MALPVLPRTRLPLVYTNPRSLPARAGEEGVDGAAVGRFGGVILGVGGVDDGVHAGNRCSEAIGRQQVADAGFDPALTQERGGVAGAGEADDLVTGSDDLFSNDGPDVTGGSGQQRLHRSISSSQAPQLYVKLIGPSLRGEKTVTSDFGTWGEGRTDARQRQIPQLGSIRWVDNRE